MLKFIIIVTCCIYFTQPTVQALAADASKDGNMLLGLCGPFVDGLDNHLLKHQNTDSIANGYCIGYLSGIQSINRIMQFIPKSRNLFCIPKENGIPIDQLARIVVKYLRDNPSQLHQNDILLVITALETAFPCIPPQK